MSTTATDRPILEAAKELQAKKSRSPWRTLLRWGTRAALLFVVLFGGFLLWVRTTCFASPPELAGVPVIVNEELVVDDSGRVHLGESWFEERPGASLMYLEGDPYSIGYASARMASDWMYLQEKSLIETVRGFLPSSLQFWGVTLLVLTNNRSLPDYVSLEYQMEIRGLADGSDDPFPHMGPRYHRILNYHAAHDISHWVWDKPVIGCNALAVKSDWTRDGHLLVGRNFDFEAGRLFDENKIIGLYRPEAGQAFLSVSWPGMSGAVTGLNAERIFCSINGAHSEDRGRIGTPSSLIVREVLQYATSLEQAIDIVRDADVFVADSYLISDGETGQAAIVEKTPAKSGVRYIEDGVLLQSNHFESEELSQDSGNREYMRVGTSLARFERLKELAEEARGELDVTRLVGILRDRRGVGAVELSPGNRGAINAMIATHSVVADVTAGVLWVSRGPHQLGEYEAYTIDSFGEPSEDVIPADPALEDGTYERLVRGRAMLADARKLLKIEEVDSLTTVLTLDVVLDLIPNDPDALTVLAQAHEAGGEPEQALDAYRRALAAYPPFPQERAAVEAAIERLTAGSRSGE